MRKTAFILPFLVFSVFASAQGLFKTIIPSVPVAAGESFRVQYFIEDASVLTDFTAPDFRPFKLVAGPDIYPGEKNHQNNFRQSKNFVFTLVAAMPGKYTIPGAVINSNGKLLRSNEVRIEIISKESAIQLLNKEQLQVSEYYLRPGEDVNEKIRQNLFLKVMVDKRSCFVGEPVVATFKLYSRLESKSDIVKNPGIYGFTVYDMIGLGDKQLATEYVNGRPFDVHTIRKVQLYPLQAGRFTIDPMEVKNKVEFSRSIVNKKTEQKIVEGLLNDEAGIPVSGTEMVETEMSTSPVTIDVKPVPEKSKPATYSGATGRFTIMASSEKSVLARNEEGFLVITISGKGNFIQLEPPFIKWPWIDEHSGRGFTYIVPRSHDVVLGGSSHDHEEDRSPDPDLTREIVARCVTLEPALAAARVLSVAVGLRPARSPLRLAPEPHPNARLVIHNYGHGGAGVTHSWGCAEAVRDLLQAHVPA